MITVKDNIVFMVRDSWAESEVFTAECLGFYFEGNKVRCDMNLTIEKSLAMFIKWHFNVPLNENIVSFYKHSKEAFIESLKATIDYPRELWPHTYDTLFNSVNKQYNILGLEMGLGKTITAATMSKYSEIGKTVVICPDVAKWNWYHELVDKWNYEGSFFSLLDRRSSRSMIGYLQEDFVIINFEQVKNFFKHLTKSEIGHIVIDEAHKIRNHKTARFVNVDKLKKEFPHAKITPMTGSLMVNRVNDLFAFFRICDHPLGRNHAFFMREHTEKINGKIKPKNIELLRLRFSNIVQRLKTEDCLDLPPLNIGNYFFEVDDLSEEYLTELDHLKESDGHMDDIKKEIDSLSIGDVSDEDKERLKELKQERIQLRIGITGNLMSLNRITAQMKVPMVIQAVENILAQGLKVVIFSTFRNPIEMLEKHFKSSCVKIYGGIDGFAKDQAVQRFLHDDDCTVFIGQNEAAGESINLVNAHHVFFMNFPLTPNFLDQPYKRLHRPGQTHPVNVYYTICKGSIDERIYELIKDKINDINEIMDKDSKGIIDYDTDIKDKLIKSLVE